MMKHYGPIKEILNYLIKITKDFKKILEIGPGHIPFPVATHFIDHVFIGPNVINLDVCNEKLPFEDNAFEFAYARHVLEDVQNPVAIFKELIRVSKQGYIETPSILAEVTRHIDASSPYWRGYVHHRYMFWNVDNTLVCIPKYPIVEYIPIQDVTPLLVDPFNWNNYYFWNKNEDAKIKELKHDIDYKIQHDYESIINNALLISHQSSQEFKDRIYKGEANVKDVAQGS
jgi:hypothetical protein